MTRQTEPATNSRRFEVDETQIVSFTFPITCASCFHWLGKIDPVLR